MLVLALTGTSKDEGKMERWQGRGRRRKNEGRKKERMIRSSGRGKNDKMKRGKIKEVLKHSRKAGDEAEREIKE